ncbi:MAG TPA: hypothetical protein VF532_12445 [Candidatus Angelobacter sp.]
MGGVMAAGLNADGYLLNVDSSGVERSDRRSVELSGEAGLRPELEALWRLLSRQPKS